MTESIRADFTADVELSDETTTGRRMRVLLNETRLAFATGDRTRVVPVGDIFDIVQAISPRAMPDASETLRLAFRDGEVRRVASLSTDASSLLRFQHVLFRVLLDGTPAVVRHTVGGERVRSAAELSLSVTATRIQFGGGDAPVAVVPRDDITEFRTGHGSLGDDRVPAVTLYWLADGRTAETVVRLSTLRLFNLFGRYLRSTAQLAAEAGTERQASIDVLLVDDDPDDLKMGGVFLKRQSDRIRLATATGAADGLEHLSGSRVDCVISDFDMPGTDGIEFLQAIREQYPELPFILFTGQGSADVAKRAIIDDVTDYVEKGVGTTQYAILAQRVRRAVD